MSRPSDRRGCGLKYAGRKDKRYAVLEALRCGMKPWWIGEAIGETTEWVRRVIEDEIASVKAAIAERENEEAPDA